MRTILPVSEGKLLSSPVQPPRDVRRLVLLSLAGVVVFLGAIGAAAVVFFGRTSQAIGVTVTSFSTTPPYVVSFRVDKPPATSVNCDIYEIDFRDNVVGQVLGVHVGPSTQKAVQVTVTVPVKGKPVQPQVEECVRGASSGQTYPTPVTSASSK